MDDDLSKEDKDQLAANIIIGVLMGTGDEETSEESFDEDVVEVETSEADESSSDESVEAEATTEKVY